MRPRVRPHPTRAGPVAPAVRMDRSPRSRDPAPEARSWPRSTPARTSRPTGRRHRHLLASDATGATTGRSRAPCRESGADAHAELADGAAHSPVGDPGRRRRRGRVLRLAGRHRLATLLRRSERPRRPRRLVRSRSPRSSGAPRGVDTGDEGLTTSSPTGCAAGRRSCAERGVAAAAARVDRGPGWASGCWARRRRAAARRPAPPLATMLETAHRRPTRWPPGCARSAPRAAPVAAPSGPAALDSDAAAVQMRHRPPEKGLQYPRGATSRSLETGVRKSSRVAIHDAAGRRMRQRRRGGAAWTTTSSAHPPRRRGEEQRLLYVALTRAQSHGRRLVGTDREHPDGGLHRMLLRPARGRTPYPQQVVTARRRRRQGVRALAARGGPPRRRPCGRPRRPPGRVPRPRWRSRASTATVDVDVAAYVLLLADRVDRPQPRQ